MRWVGNAFAGSSHAWAGGASGAAVDTRRVPTQPTSGASASKAIHTRPRRARGSVIPPPAGVSVRRVGALDLVELLLHRRRVVLGGGEGALVGDARVGELARGAQRVAQVLLHGAVGGHPVRRLLQLL